MKILSVNETNKILQELPKWQSREDNKIYEEAKKNLMGKIEKLRKDEIIILTKDIYPFRSHPGFILRELVKIVKIKKVKNSYYYLQKI